MLICLRLGLVPSGPGALFNISARCLWFVCCICPAWLLAASGQRGGSAWLRLVNPARVEGAKTTGEVYTGSGRIVVEECAVMSETETKRQMKTTEDLFKEYCQGSEQWKVARACRRLVSNEHVCVCVCVFIRPDFGSSNAGIKYQGCGSVKDVTIPAKGGVRGKGVRVSEKSTN